MPANTPQPITYQAQIPSGTTVAPGTALTNLAQIDVPGDNRPAAARQATATVTVPNNGATTLGKSAEANTLSFYGDSSAWDLVVRSQDPVSNPYTDTIDILPNKADGRGTTIDGTYSVTGVTAPAGSTVYYSTAPIASLSNDPRAASNGGTPGSTTGNTVGWSTTAVAHPTAVRVIGPALAPGGSQTIRIAFTTPAGSSCTAPAASDNKPGQLLVNSANSIAGHTALPMLSSATTAIGDCYALDLKKYVLVKGGNPAKAGDWHDANSVADYQQYAAGDTVPYKITVTNKGTGTLTNIPVTDSLVPGCDFTVASLAAGASASNTCSSTAVVGTTVNVASTSVTPPSGPVLTATDPAGIVVPDPYRVVKTANPAPGTAVAPGGTVTYTITVSEPAGSSAPSLNPSLTDDLSKVLDDATYNGDVTASAGTASVSGKTLQWSAASIMPGQTITITYSVKVNNPDTGDKVLTNVVTTPSGGNCVTGNTDPACTVTTNVESFTVAKSASVAQAAEGQTVTYTVTVTNTGTAAYTAAHPASFTDSLAGVLDDATYNNDASNGATYAAPTVSWSGALAVGATTTVTYSVTVKTPDGGDHVLKNAVTPTGDGGSCATAGACATRTPVASYTVAKTASAATTTPGGVVVYTVTVTNTGQVGYTAANPASFTDSLAGVLDDATYNGDANNGATYAAPTISWSGALAIGATRTITYSVTVNTPDAGDHLLKNAVVPTGSGGSCTTAADCSTTTAVGSYTVAKTASTASTTPGSTVTYTIVVTNTGQVAYTAAKPATITDNLTGVLDDAVYNNDASNGATYAAPTLSWAGPLAIGATQTITYSVTVRNPDRGDHVLKNTVSTPPGVGNCDAGSADPACSTVTPVKSYRVVKTSPATTVTPGQVVPYTITITNTGQVPYTAADPAVFTDDLTRVLDDAVYNGDATNGATLTGSTLSWSGALAVGATVTVTYSVTVNTPDAGDHVLDNAVVTGVTGNCAPGSTDPSCAVQIPTKAFHVTKSASSSTTTPGATVTYTIVVTNTGQVDYPASAPASFTDDLTAVLDDATYNNDATNGAVYSAPTLSWSGALPVGASRTITYTVTVKDPDAGDHVLDNTVVTPPGLGGDCTVDSTDPDCSVRVPVQSYTVAKAASTATTTEGSRVTYTVTVTNTGAVDYTAAAPATFTDDLTKVLDDAVYNNDATNGATYAAPTLSWAGALPVGGTKTISYSVTVASPDHGDHSLKNSVAPTADGGSCATAGGCATTTPVQSYSVVKTSSTTTTEPGGTVSYTITVTNTGQVPFTAANPASFTDDLTSVLDDATYNNDATNAAVYSAPVLSWSGALAIGATHTVTYSVTVKSPDTGDKLLTNAVVTPTGPCVSGSTDPDCVVVVPVKSYSTVKTASAVDTTPGATVTYTIVVTNTGAVPYTAAAPATFRDDLSRVLDDATYNNDATGGAVYAAPTLSWAGALPVGGTATITYSVTVKSPDTGDHVLRNAVVTPTGPCAAGSTDSTCTTTVPVRSYHVAKKSSATTVAPGGVVTYTITVTNTGAVPFTSSAPATFTDDLTDVLTGATYNADATSGATYTAPTLAWAGALAVGQTVHVTYSVRLLAADRPGTVLHNVVATPTDPAGEVSNCLAGDTDPDCAADVTVDPPGVPPTDPPAASTPLARTGSDLLPPFLWGALLLLTGFGLVLGARLRRRRRS
ncbi:beta strand repeat-containing protein [Leifsonia shinshuensis]|uniref:Putative repeat protein (TIGR01451 family)/fimbrial isopeptide formation D2 family protein n=1 Tax=Leifsonia shinshuensis TaxID=150026 RepID=A0A853CPP3_9MICO|nr:putative repeat protein (TIGR01451 family)/fimbrial isopeptide formation D2 family protein [Leifsonia shinshuensis]